MSPPTSDQQHHPEAPPGSDSAYRIAVRSAAVALVFSVVVCALLLYDYQLRRPDDPLEVTAIKAMRLALKQQPDDETLKAQFRELDRQLREEWVRRRAFSRMGGWLLLGGVTVFLIAAKWAATLRRQLPRPQPQVLPRDFEAQWTPIARWAVGLLCVLLVGVAVGLGLTGQSAVSLDEVTAPASPGLPASPAVASSSAPPPPSAEEIAKWWPRFRGPGGRGISAYTNVPESWNERAGQNIRWKVPVELPGYNSPIVWQQRVFLTGATEDRREVYCFDADTGELLWRRDVAATPQGKAPMKEPEFAGYAAPTAVTDGRWVCAIFANGDVVAFDYQGNQAWIRGLGVPKNAYGHAASLAMYKNLLLVQFDQGTKKEGLSKLLALDVTEGGKTVWAAPREVPSSWPSPILINYQGRDQVITAADPWLIAYDPAAGGELWRAKILGQDVGPSPTFGNGLVYVANEYSMYCAAVRPDGSGDVTQTHIVWKGEDGLPNTCSPLASSDYLFLLADGILTCYDAKTGEMLWDEYETFDAVTFTSSPSLVGERVYLFGELEREDQKDEQGNPVTYAKTWILLPGREGCKILNTCELDEGCVTSPAFQDGRIYVRGAKHLYCIAEKQE